MAISDILSSGGGAELNWASCVRFTNTEHMQSVQADGVNNYRNPYGFFVNPYFCNVTIQF